MDGRSIWPRIVEKSNDDHRIRVQSVFHPWPFRMPEFRPLRSNVRPATTSHSSSPADRGYRGSSVVNRPRRSIEARAYPEEASRHVLLEILKMIIVIADNGDHPLAKPRSRPLARPPAADQLGHGPLILRYDDDIIRAKFGNDFSQLGLGHIDADIGCHDLHLPRKA